MTENSALGPEAQVGWLVRYVPADEDVEERRASWGANKNPIGLLVPGATYEVTRVEVHAWHTKLWLEGCGPYNSTHFERA